MKNQLLMTVMVALLISGFVSCKKKEEEQSKPKKSIYTLPLGNVLIYSNEADWLKGVNPIIQGVANDKGDFTFDNQLEDGTYYLSIFKDKNYLYHNDIPYSYASKTFTISNNGAGFSMDGSVTTSDYADPFKYRYAFLGESVETNWVVSEFSNNGGIHNSTCVSQNKLKINRKYGIKITLGSPCNTSFSYDYAISFGSNAQATWATSEITKFDIYHSGTTSGLYTLEILEKTADRATKIKLAQKSTPANYEIYIIR